MRPTKVATAQNSRRYWPRNAARTPLARLLSQASCLARSPPGQVVLPLPGALDAGPCSQLALFHTLKKTNTEVSPKPRVFVAPCESQIRVIRYICCFYVLLYGRLRDINPRTCRSFCTAKAQHSAASTGTTKGGEAKRAQWNNNSLARSAVAQGGL